MRSSGSPRSAPGGCPARSPGRGAAPSSSSTPLGLRNVLVTNDDGVDAPGLRVMLEVALLIGGRIVVAAPDRDWSGCGSATGDRSRLGPVEPLGARDGGGWDPGGGTPRAPGWV